eukprot:Pgem_evm1s5054
MLPHYQLATKHTRITLKVFQTWAIMLPMTMPLTHQGPAKRHTSMHTEGCDPYENSDTNDKNDKLPITKGPVYDNKTVASKACDEMAAADENNKIKIFLASYFNGQCTYTCKTDKVKLQGPCDGISAEQREIEENKKPTKGPVYPDIIKASKACDEKAAADKDNKMKSFSSSTYNGRCTYLCKMDKVKLEGSCDGKEHVTVVKQQHQNNNSSVSINTLGIFTGLLAFMINIY